MLRGELVGLRARIASDVPVLHAGLYDDEPTWSRASTNAWRPIDAESAESPYAIVAPSDKAAIFSVIGLDDESLLGESLLWGIDLVSRSAHLGLSLLPAARGKGYGADVVQVLCRYGFVIRGFHRLQIETLADNDAMIAAAKKAGFVAEGLLRSSAWVAGEFVDEVLFGLLASEWNSSRAND